jgi:hypothetical protein
MTHKKCILSVLLVTASVTSFTCNGIPLSDYIESLILPTRSTTSVNRQPLNSVDKIDIAYKVVMAMNVVYHLASAAKSCILPDTKEQIQILMFKKQWEIFMAKEELNASLLEHRLEAKNAMGIPDSCKEAALAFAMTAGIEELNKAVQEFKEAYGQAS